MNYRPEGDDYKLHLVTIPVDVDRWGLPVYEQAAMTSEMLKGFGQAAKVLMTRRERRIVQRPYQDDGAVPPSTPMREKLEQVLRWDVMHDAIDRGLTVLSISPARFEPHPVIPGGGEAFMEYTAIPMSAWEGKR